ncbi:TrkH family potassium uptake protein [candidate division KSB1 bacterium]
MRIQSVIHILGLLLFFLGLSMLLPLTYSIACSESCWEGIFYSFIITSASGTVIYLLTKIKSEIRAKEGFAIVAFGWFLLSLFGMLPFLLTGSINTFVDAFFETASGFTTTGASILTNIEILPKSILLWRSQIQWMGGMGIIVMSIAILPILGVGGMQLFKAEVPGPTHDKLTPRVGQVAKILWGVYVFLSAIEIILLKVCGMSLFDSVCHTFTCMATGGFSTKNASIGAYNSIYIDGITTLFMFIAGINFTLHYRALKGKPLDYFKDKEFLFYTGILAVATLYLTIDTFIVNYKDMGEAFQKSIFQSVSIGTTTGFATADYSKWSQTCQLILFTLMFFGGCSGSTGGGMKIIRVMLLIKSSIAEIKKSIHPSAIISVKMGNRSVPNDVLSKILAFFLLYITIFAVTAVVMTFLGLDMVSAMGASVACISNIGPGLGSVGPVSNYADVHYLGKWLLSFCMIVGRLELYTVLVLFSKSFWKV